MKYFLLDQTDDIAILTLNQPQGMNSFSMEVQNEFIVVLDKLEKNKSIHGLIITGAGKAFAAGADIKQMSTMIAEEAIAFSKLGNMVFDRIENLKNRMLAPLC